MAELRDYRESRCLQFWCHGPEILCGRKNLDRCQSEDDAHLLGLFKRKAENGDKDNKDMQLHGSLVVEIMIRLLHGACKVITG